MGQLSKWLNAGSVQRLVVVVTGVESGETLERWQFNVSLDDEADGGKEGKGGTDENGNTINTAGRDGAKETKKKHKTEKEVRDAGRVKEGEGFFL